MDKHFSVEDEDESFENIKPGCSNGRIYVTRITRQPKLLDFMNMKSFEDLAGPGKGKKCVDLDFAGWISLPFSPNNGLDKQPFPNSKGADVNSEFIGANLRSGSSVVFWDFIIKNA